MSSKKKIQQGKTNVSIDIDNSGSSRSSSSSSEECLDLELGEEDNASNDEEMVEEQI